MTTRTSAKDLVWENISSGFTKARAEKELEAEKVFHPNHYVKMKRFSVGNWGIFIARKPRTGRKRATASEIGSDSSARRLNRVGRR